MYFKFKTGDIVRLKKKYNKRGKHRIVSGTFRANFEEGYELELYIMKDIRYVSDEALSVVLKDDIEKVKE